MWPLLYLPNVINLVVFEVPVAVSVFFHLNTGGSVASLVPFAHLALRMGWGAAIPYFNMKALHHHARLDAPPAPIVNGIAQANISALAQHRVQLLFTRKPQETGLIEWRLQDHELALYRPHAFQPICLRRTTTDIVEWTLKDRQLAVIGPIETNPVCLPRTPTDLIVWRPEDRELAVIPSNAVRIDAFFEFQIDLEYVDERVQSECCPHSSILLLALAVGSGIVGGTRHILATGQGLDWASVLADGNVAELAHASQGMEDDGGCERVDDVDMSGSTITDAPVALKPCLKKRPRIPRFLPPMRPPIVDGPSRLTRAVSDVRLPRGRKGYSFGPDPILQPIYLYGSERLPPRPEPFFRFDVLPPIPERILDIVPQTTMDLQSLVKACVTQDCPYYKPPAMIVQECTQCQVCPLVDEQLRWSNNGTHFERLMDYMDASLASLAPFIFSSMKLALVVGWVVGVLGFQSYARVVIKGHNILVGHLVDHLLVEASWIRFWFCVLLLVNVLGVLTSPMVFGEGTTTTRLKRRRFRVFDVTSKSPNMLRMEAAASLRMVRFKFDPEDTGRGVPKPRPRPSSVTFLNSPNQNFSPVPAKDPPRGQLRRRANPSDTGIALRLSKYSPSRSSAG